MKIVNRNIAFLLVAVLLIQACVQDVEPVVTKPLFYQPDGFPATSGQLANNPVTYYEIGRAHV